jgi:hypothetical protein
MVEEKSGEESGKALLKKDTSKKIKYFLSKRVIKDNDVYYLLKDFLREYTGVDYHFTHQEIITELKNVYVPAGIRKDFFDLIDEVFSFEYIKKDYSDKELRGFLERFEKYLDELIVIHKREIPRSEKFRAFIENIFLRKNKKELKKELVDEEEPVELMSVEEKLPVIEGKNKFEIQFKTVMEQMYYSLDNDDAETAKNHYYELINLYNTLSSKDKQVYYEKLNFAYKDLTSNF